MIAIGLGEGIELMIVAGVFGLFLGLYEIDPLISSGVVVGVVLLRTFLDLVSSENFITRGPTSYTLYKQARERRGGSVNQPWKGFLVHTLVSGVGAGLAAYGATRWIVSMQ